MRASKSVASSSNMNDCLYDSRNSPNYSDRYSMTADREAGSIRYPIIHCSRAHRPIFKIEKEISNITWVCAWFVLINFPSY